MDSRTHCQRKPELNHQHSCYIWTHRDITVCIYYTWNCGVAPGAFVAVVEDAAVVFGVGFAAVHDEAGVQCVVILLKEGLGVAPVSTVDASRCGCGGALVGRQSSQSLEPAGGG